MKSMRPHECVLSVDWLPGSTEVDVIYADAGGWKIQTTAQLDWSGAPVIPTDSKLTFSNDGNGTFSVELTGETLRNMPDDPKKVLYGAVWTVDLAGVNLTIPAAAAVRRREFVQTYPPTE
jgi:hypothetical protein